MITKQDAARIVEKRLAISQFPGGVTFTVIPAQVETGDNWLRVPIHPSFWPERMYPIYEELAHLEEDIANTEGVDLFLYLGEPIPTPEGANEAAAPAAR